MQLIERGIYYEDSFLGVTLGGLVFSHGTIIIDAPLRAEDARSWRSALLNQRGGSNRLLINLDANPDRTLGDRALECTIVAHTKTAQVFRNRPTIFKGQSVESGAAWEAYGDAIGMRWATPDITFTQRMSLHWGGPEVVLEHHPGPTPGATWVVIPEAKVVFVGDAVVMGQPPFLANADLALWHDALELLINSFGDYTIISGRGGPATMESIRKQQQYLVKIERKCEQLFEEKSPAEATERLVPGLLADFSFPPEKRDAYTKRLKFGLYQYYNRHYRTANQLEQYRDEDEEE